MKNPEHQAGICDLCRKTIPRFPNGSEEVKSGNHTGDRDEYRITLSVPNISGTIWAELLKPLTYVVCPDCDCAISAYVICEIEAKRDSYAWMGKAADSDWACNSGMSSSETPDEKKSTENPQ